jgi:hypothetical protein
MAREFSQMSKDVVSTICFKLVMQDPKGHSEKEQAKERTQAMDKFRFHQKPTANLKSLMSNLHFCSEAHSRVSGDEKHLPGQHE